MSDTHDTAQLVPINIPGASKPVTASSVAGAVLVSVRHACDAMSIDFSGQMQRLARTSWATVVMTPTVAEDGKVRELAMLDRRTFTMWLATIDTRRVKNPEAAATIEAFQAEAAEALDAYFHEGGAINPSATEDQLDRLARQAEAQARVLGALKGIVDPKHLEAKGRIVLARALGEAPELDRDSIPLYVSDYLSEKGLSSSLITAKASGFGKRLKGLYISEHGSDPQVSYQTLPNGTVREVKAYTQADRPLFDAVWNKHYADVVMGGVA